MDEKERLNKELVAQQRQTGLLFLVGRNFVDAVSGCDITKGEVLMALAFASEMGLDNRCTTKLRDLFRKYGIVEKIGYRFVRRLKELNVIVRVEGENAIMVNPTMFYRGGIKYHKQAVNRYERISDARSCFPTNKPRKA